MTLRHCRRRPTLRPAYTFLELMLSSMVTALVAASGASMVFAIANASQQTRETREQKNTGGYTLARVGKTVRESRGVGYVDSSNVVVWVEDRNNDDAISLYEVSLIRYDADQKKVFYDYVEEPSDNPAPISVTKAQFTDPTIVKSLMNAHDQVTVEWARDVEALSFKGYPAQTETRIVDVKLKVGTGEKQSTFTSTATPKAPADYLFDTRIQMDDPNGSGRKLRKLPSPWDGLSDIPDTTVNPRT